MKALFVILISIFLLFSCSTQKVTWVKKYWFSGYELELMLGKDEAKKIIKECQRTWNKDRKTIRDNMRTGNIEYYIEDGFLVTYD